MQGRLDEAAEIMGGRVISGDPAGRWSGVALDSRAVAGGELFFALPGERTDGHLFVGDALARGAAAAVIHRDVDTPPAAPRIGVSHTLEGLHALTRERRQRMSGGLVAVTGSSGKTTTKELLATMLARRFRTARSPGNLNNLYGFPLALLAIPDDTEWMVAEMGMSTTGELRRIGILGRPDVVVYTNVRPVHLEFLGSLAAIAEAKAELLEGMAPDGLVVVNADDPELLRIAERAPGRVVFYGIDSDADVRAVDLREPEGGGAGTVFRLVAGGDSFRVDLPLHGRYNVENFLAAAACACELGVPAADVAASAASLSPPAMRGVIHPLPAGGTLVDDSYNSNPDALRQALESAARLPGRRRWAVLGEMLELGPAAERFHREAGATAAELGFSPVVGVGELARGLVEEAAARGAEGSWHADAAAAAAAAGSELEGGDVVLVKGSRGVGLESVVLALLASVEVEEA